VETADFITTGALDADLHRDLYLERPADGEVRRALMQVGKSCVLISLIGARQTGKTSLLNRLHAEYDTPNSGWTIISLDLMEISEDEGEIWYRQFIALCREQLKRSAIHLSNEQFEASCAPLSIQPYTARGWAQWLRLACQQLPTNQRLLVSLDEISSIPRQQWESFFSNVRAIHQAATSSSKSPEYRRIGMMLVGAFVPSQLINIVEKSPFNVSTKIYMSPASIDKTWALLKLLDAKGIMLSDGMRDGIYRWSGGLPYHIQRMAALILSTYQGTSQLPNIDALAESIIVDDAFIGHIARQLQAHPSLIELTSRILSKPFKSGRNIEQIAILEIMGVIHLDSAKNECSIFNRLVQEFLRRYIVTNLFSPAPTATGAIVLKQAVDFLFDHAVPILQLRHEARQQRGGFNDIPPLPAGIQMTTREDILNRHMPSILDPDFVQRLDHCLTQLRQNIDAQRKIEQLIAAKGGWMQSDIRDLKQLEATEDDVKWQCQELKNVLTQIYKYDITIPGLS